MEITEAIIELKNSLGKYAKSRIFHLAEAAEELKVTEKYLIDLARNGKIKAFKVGEHWFIEEAWINDFRQVMKGLLHQVVEAENSLHLQRSGWSRTAKKSFVPHPIFKLAFSTVTASVVLALLGVAFSFFTLPLLYLSLNRQAVGQAFLAGTYRVYGYPIKTVSGINIPINDERLTGTLYSLMGQPVPGKACQPALGGSADCGLVAGAFEFKLEE